MEKLRKDNLLKKLDGFYNMTGIEVNLWDSKNGCFTSNSDLSYFHSFCIGNLLERPENITLAKTPCGLVFGMIRYYDNIWIAGPVVTNVQNMEVTTTAINHYNCMDEKHQTKFLNQIKNLPSMSLSNFEYNLMVLTSAIIGVDIAELECEYVVQKDALLCQVEDGSDQITDHKLQVCVEFIRKNIDESLCLKSIADYCGYNPAYLSRKFKKVYGINLNKFILETKLNMAADYLIHSDKSLSEISVDLCFASQSHFQNAFKAVYRMTPLEFKKQRRKTRYIMTLSGEDSLNKKIAHV